jgi:HD-GYP domain-containing protein (c-di-GMP phosphodiesterase class II)
VIGVAEVFDVLTTSRPYQERMEPDLAIDHMREMVGTIIGPEEIEAMAAVASRRQALVFIEDESQKAYPAGIPHGTLDGAVPAAPANPGTEP